jgi:2-dehydro-3-deoxygalactonokinase
MMGQAQGARLIGLDWGTSSLRAYLFGDDGHKLSESSAPSGVMQLQRLIPPENPHIKTEKLFEAALGEVCDPWLEEAPDLPILACGMVGSTVGWKEAAYLQMPLSPSELGKGLTTVLRADGKPVHIVPGVSSPGIQGKTFPEIMRGEETQIAGILATRSKSDSVAPGPLLIGLPGTHSKWALVNEGRLVSFSTFVTGEMYALLTNYSVVARGANPPERLHQASFRQGLMSGRAQNGEAAGGLLSLIFSTRSKHVLGELKAEQQPDYLSGLLIGDELAGVQRIMTREKLALRAFSQIILSGEKSLCERYQLACDLSLWPRAKIIETAVEKGLWSVAREAGLVE